MKLYKQFLKLFIAMIISVICLICLNCIAAFAAASSVQVGYVTLSSGEYTTDGTTKKTGTPSGTGYAYYNNGVLTLSYFCYEGGGDNNSVIYADSAFDIEAEGVNTINSTVPDAIRTEDADVTISGGNLNLKIPADGSEEAPAAIRLKRYLQSNYGGSLTVQNTVLNCELSAEADYNMHEPYLINSQECSIKSSSVTISFAGNANLGMASYGIVANTAVENSSLIFKRADELTGSINAMRTYYGTIEITNSYVACEGEFACVFNSNSGSYTFNSGTLKLNATTGYGAVTVYGSTTFNLPTVDYWWRTSETDSFTKNGFTYNNNSYLEITTINPNSTCDHSGSSIQPGCTYSAICSVCGEEIAATGGYDTYGFCTNCGGYQPATLNSSGIYEISNPGQLFWFASLINGDTTQEGIMAAVSNANAVLTSNINLGITTSTHTNTEWTPIGSESAPFSGTFDGAGFEVSGMSITTAADYVGFFGYVTGTVKNMTVDGSINVTSSGGIDVGGIAGCVYAGTLSNLTSTVSITGSDDTKGNYAGIAGSAMGDNNTAGSTVEECVYSGELTASGNLDCIGGIVGYINAATINNCANLGTVDTTGGTSGGIYTGGILGYCNNTSAVIKNSYNYGTVKGAGSYIGAVVGRINTNIGSLSNCYYLSGTASAGYGANASSIDADSSITVKTADEFESGEVAWNLQNANDDYVWGQDLDTDPYPVLTSDTNIKVVKVSFCKSTNGTVLLESYANAGGTLSSYLTGDEYTFYSDSALTDEIGDISTRIFSADTNIYVVTTHDLTIIESNADTITEGTDYTYENNLLTVLTGGNYTISGTSMTDTIKVTSSDDVTITLAGVDITNGSKPPMEIDCVGNVTIKLSGGNILTAQDTGTEEAYAGLQKTSTDNTLYITSADGDGETSGNLTATGGCNIYGLGGAGIGGGVYFDTSIDDCVGGDGSNITISGGTITAYGGNSAYGGAGIGGGGGSTRNGGKGSNIVINGGIINAYSTGAYSAGIGGGESGSGTVTITGGTITASSSYGAGIGSGKNGSGTVTITGGTVTAEGGSGAGIGGGESGSGTVTITGGTITAGSSYGAGIGTGSWSTTDPTTVDISGGYITILQGSDIDETIVNYGAKYIGSGNYSTAANTVTITGGYFGSGNVADGTVYDMTVADGYSVLNNNDTATKGTYPVYVGKAYTVTQSLTNITSSNADTKTVVGGSYSTTLTGTDCYVLPSNITVTMGGTELTAGTGYTYNSSTGELSISNVTGNIVITATATDTSHSYNNGVVTIEPTCTEKGVMTYTCTVCGDTYTEVIPATGHTEGEAVTENEKAATCTEDGFYDIVVYCSFCGEELSRETISVPATGHTTETQNAKEATCTEDGYTGDEVCTVCGETVSTGSVIPATGHTTEVQNAKEATCTENGYTGDEVCTVCGETVAAGSVISATGHTTEIQNAKEATCTENGYTGDEVCTICGETVAAGSVISAQDTQQKYKMQKQPLVPRTVIQAMRFVKYAVKP